MTGPTSAAVPDDLRPQLDEAESALRRALALRPADVPMRLELARLLGARGRLEAAAMELAVVVAQEPRHAAAWRSLALLLRALGHPDAEGGLRRALQESPADPALTAELGRLLVESGRHGEACAVLAPALLATPDDAMLQFIQGCALEALGSTDAAALAYRRAISLTPDLAAAHAGLGSTLQALDRLKEAATVLRRVLRLRPLDSGARTALGAALRRLGHSREAEGELRRALTLSPNHAPAYANLGALRLHGQDEAAAAQALDRALRLDPSLAEARLNRGFLHLTQGTLAAGWDDYSARFAARRSRPPPPHTPQWNGAPLAGRTILVTPEQGVGDEILFASCLPDLITQAGRVIMECDPRLIPLFARSFPKADVRPKGSVAAGEADVQAPAGSLPRFLRRHLSAFPAVPSWLVADPERVAGWDRRLDALGTGLRVGIAWRSGLMTTERRAAYTALDQWAPLFAVPGLRLVNLQYGDCEAELRDAERRFAITIHRWPDLDLKDDFENTAALTAALDLVIAPSVSSGELAGALGVPVWRIGHRDWTQLGTGVRPWYPSMRLFTARHGESLPAVLGRMATELRRIGAPGAPPESPGQTF